VQDVLPALADQLDELRGLVADRSEADLTQPTRCEGWTATDVLLHLAQTNEAAIASVAGGLEGLQLAGVERRPGDVDVDDLADAAVVAERHLGPDAIRQRWLNSADEMLAAFEAADPHARVLWVAGWMAARTLASTRLSETWIHTVDVASAFDVVPAPTDRLWHVARLAWRTVPYAFEQAGRELHGPVAFELTAPDGGVWSFRPPEDTPVLTVVHGTAADLCEVAGQRADATQTGLTAEGPDAGDVLALIRTFA
jgi:uncharacterized protein (TIGR03084 family)